MFCVSSRLLGLGVSRCFFVLPHYRDCTRYHGFTSSNAGISCTVHFLDESFSLLSDGCIFQLGLADINVWSREVARWL